MRDCIDYHRRYMSLMITARGCGNARIQRGLINEAYRWLNRWFDAVEVELSRNRRIGRQHSKVDRFRYGPSKGAA